MPTLLPTSGRTAFGATNFAGGRNYDYTKIYDPPDKPTEDGIKDNARVWNVYLDEAENYDADMIHGFHNIIDSLLIFASLFSAVVTTFVVQTSQSLQMDKSQVMIALLSENNQLLRAAGNRTSISTVPTAPLGAESQSYTSIDVWVNGLFFTSLTLSLSTALLSVLAKQWVQGYTAIVLGSAKTRALIRHYRFQGLTKWHLSDIIESLPLILHSSVAIFLVGLALYVSQLSRPICGFVSAITALTFLFYFVTSCLPALYVACPYRIPFMFWLARLLLFAFRFTKFTFLRLCKLRTKGQYSASWPQMPKESLRTAENNEVFLYLNRYLLGGISHLICDSLDWLFDLSSNHSVKNVVIEGVCSLLHETSINHSQWRLQRSFRSESNDLCLSTVTYSLSQLSSDTPSISMTEECLNQNPHVDFIENIIKFSSSTSLLDGPITELKDDWQQAIKVGLMSAYRTAIEKRYHALSSRILDWGYPDMTLLESRYGYDALIYCVKRGDGEAICGFVDRGIDIKNWRDSLTGHTILHRAVEAGNLPGVKALVQRESSLISAQVPSPTDHLRKTCTALDFTIHLGNTEVASYLLDAGAKPPSDALHIAVSSLGGIPRGPMVPRWRLRMIDFLLDHGWDRTVEDVDGKTPVDIARSMGLDAIAEHLKQYQTVRYPPYPTMSLSDN